MSREVIAELVVPPDSPVIGVATALPVHNNRQDSTPPKPCIFVLGTFSSFPGPNLNLWNYTFEM